MWIPCHQHPPCQFSWADIFVYACSMSLFVCFFPRQPLRFEGVPSLLPATLPPPLFKSSSLLLSSLPSSMLPFRYPPSLPRALAVTASTVPRCIVGTIATMGAVSPLPRECAM